MRTIRIGMAILLLTGVEIFSQVPPPPPSNHGSGGNQPSGGGAPVGGGVGILLAMAAIYGGSKVYRKVVQINRLEE